MEESCILFKGSPPILSVHSMVLEDTDAKEVFFTLKVPKEVDSFLGPDTRASTDVIHRVTHQELSVEEGQPMALKLILLLLLNAVESYIIPDLSKTLDNKWSNCGLMFSTRPAIMNTFRDLPEIFIPRADRIVTPFLCAS